MFSWSSVIKHCRRSSTSFNINKAPRQKIDTFSRKMLPDGSKNLTEMLTLLSWPAQSPDFYPVENLWDEIKRDIWELNPVPSNLMAMESENRHIMHVVSNSSYKNNQPTTHTVQFKKYP
ncbi:hypothetical protein TNCV_349951 [Trichonephila clavipes]|nr:hypothetical protein TNCV_349951 [Trichonephila clavipes]